jgi:hypothetical protein
MVSASTRLRSTVPLDQTPGPETTRLTQRPGAQWKVELTADTATIVAPYLNAADNLAEMSNDDSPCILSIAGTGCVRNTREGIANAQIVHTNGIDSVLITDTRLPTSEEYQRITEFADAFFAVCRDQDEAPETARDRVDAWSTVHGNPKSRASATKVTSFSPRIAVAAVRLGRKRRSGDAASGSSSNLRVTANSW